MPRSESELKARWARRAPIAFAVGLVLTLAALILGFLMPAGPGPMLRGWMLGWLGWVAIAVGSLGLSILRHTLKSRWGLPIIRILEAASGWPVLAVLAVAFLPVVADMGYVFPWVSPEKQTWYLNPAFFTARFVLYFAVWFGYSIALRRSSTADEPDGQIERERWRSNICAPGLVVIFFTASFACFDWIMSLQQDWTSTIFGLLFVIGCALVALSFALSMLRDHRDDEPYADLTHPAMTRDLGNLLLVILLLWAYFNYSQYIIMWSGDIKREVRYFTDRPRFWDLIAEILIVLGFFGPLFALTAPRVKGDIRLLGALARWMLIIGWLDLIYMAAPHLVASRPILTSAYAAVVFCGIGSLWHAAYLRHLIAAPLAPRFESRAGRTIEHVSA